jgi:protein LTV1
MTSIDNKFEQVMRLYDANGVDGEDLSDVSLSYSDAEFPEAEVGEAEMMEALDEFLENQRDFIKPNAEERKNGAAILLNEIRAEMGPLSQTILDRELSDTPTDLDEDLFSDSDSSSVEFDCQSFVTTYTNTDNIPTVIRDGRPARSAAIADPIRLSRRTGLPIPSTSPLAFDKSRMDSAGEELDSEYSRTNKGKARNREETAEEKKSRKAAIKEERRQNRSTKKELKVRFQLGLEDNDMATKKGNSENKKPLRGILKI